MENDPQTYRVAVQLPAQQYAYWIYKVRDALKENGIAGGAFCGNSTEAPPMMQIAASNAIGNSDALAWLIEYEHEHSTTERQFRYRIVEIHYDAAGPHGNNPLTYVMEFNDRDLALLFKLTWGGA